MRELVTVVRRLARRVDELEFRAPVAWVYNPLDYARAATEAYLLRYAKPEVDALWLGMNPGPFGMAQTGVPFGEVHAVREWLGIDEKVGKPSREHPKRPIDGFDCARSEVSGARLWGFAKERYGTPEAFFRRFFVWNYCPLVFMSASGANVTPDKIAKEDQDDLHAACDAALAEFVATMKPRRILGIGEFAAKRARAALGSTGLPVDSILHPSPASPAANRGWSAQASARLVELGLGN
jgi:single-strand selective monofunctional uracil DNA glycosylase